MFITPSSTNRNSFRLPEHITGYVPTQSVSFRIETLMDSGIVHRTGLGQRAIIYLVNSCGLLKYVRLNAGLAEESEQFKKAHDRTLLEYSGTLWERG